MTNESYWSRSADTLLAALQSQPAGLSSAEAARRLALAAPADAGRSRLSRARVLARQFGSPLLWLLLFAAVVALAAGEWSDAIIVLVIVGAAVAIGYGREYRAERAAEALNARVRTQATVLRDGQPVAVERSAVVPGDIVLLAAGALVPADAVVLEATDCFVSEALLTGESFPVPKRPGAVASAARLAERTNCVFLGTNVRSGLARAVVVLTGPATEFARIAGRLTRAAPETSFDHGLRRFGYLLTSAMLVIVLLVFAIHVIAGRPPVETLLFSIALAVGLSPELLPAILTINLARGAQKMAKRGVLVRRLNAIENLGSMDVLCTDKTGTLTEGTVVFDGAYDAAGQSSPGVLRAGGINARFQAGLANPLDEAILRAGDPDAARAVKLGEIPFDFMRRRLSVVIRDGEAVTLITKGAFASVIGICTHLTDGTPLDAGRLSALDERYQQWSRAGLRVIAVAKRSIADKVHYTPDDEANLAFLGYLTFLDPPKAGVIEAIKDLDALGVQVKLITGDNRLVAAHLAMLVGMRADRLLSGDDLDRLEGAALWHAVQRTDLFVEVDPNQKERVILALKRAGHVVGFLGDGINDAPAMHAADTSLSVDTAADVARETADFVLLERDLDVIRGGIEDGRRTFANTMKYILTTSSANLGNMISMAAASLFLPFLPLLAGQILLNNLLSDVPAVGLADDEVDPELVARPLRWDIGFVGRFMGVFGLISSAFDFITFAVLLWGFQASVTLFRTGWFVESLLTELVIALVVRTRRPFFQSRPGRVLLVTTVVMSAMTLVIPYLEPSRWIGFTPLPPGLMLSLIAITGAYVVATEAGKVWFYRFSTRAAGSGVPRFRGSGGSVV